VEQLDMLMWSAGASRVKTLAAPDAVADSQANVPACGSICTESCAKCGPLGSLLKTSLLLELEALTGYWVTWKGLTTPAGRSWWVLMDLAPHTDGTASGLLEETWPTPTARDWKDTPGQATCKRDHLYCDLLPRRVFAGLQDPTNPSSNGKPLEPFTLLNADWVLQLMGYPREWARLSTRRASRPQEIP
jgi:hypothetical protein